MPDEGRDVLLSVDHRLAPSPSTADEVHLLEGLAALLSEFAQHRAATGELFAVDMTDPDGPRTGGCVGDAVPVAAGMLSAHPGIEITRASAWSHVHACAVGATVHEVARDVLAGRTHLDEVTRPARRRRGPGCAARGGRSSG